MCWFLWCNNSWKNPAHATVVFTPAGESQEPVFGSNKAAHGFHRLGNERNTLGHTRKPAVAVHEEFGTIISGQAV